MSSCFFFSSFFCFSSSFSFFFSTFSFSTFSFSTFSFSTFSFCVCVFIGGGGTVFNFCISIGNDIVCNGFFIIVDCGIFRFMLLPSKVLLKSILKLLYFFFCSMKSFISCKFIVLLFEISKTFIFLNSEGILAFLSPSTCLKNKKAIFVNLIFVFCK